MTYCVESARWQMFYKKAKPGASPELFTSINGVYIEGRGRLCQNQSVLTSFLTSAVGLQCYDSCALHLWEDLKQSVTKETHNFLHVKVNWEGILLPQLLGNCTNRKMRFLIRLMNSLFETSNETNKDTLKAISVVNETTTTKDLY